jgi:RNA polymerase-associated protein CTR9
LASAGISAIALGNKLSSGGDNKEEELRSVADARFTKADNINQVYPPTWIGRGMLNLSLGRIDQARFFFEQLTLRECGEILPALLGMAAVKFAEKDYAGAQSLYGRAIQKFPNCGAAVRVGYGLACYNLGQIDRAKAAFSRAVDIDSENVEALLALAILEMGGLDSSVQNGKEYRAAAERVMKRISMANMIDPTNGMVQNHLANHYFWKWSPVPGVSVAVEKGSNVVKGGGVGNSVEVGDRVRIGDWETQVVDVDEMDESVRVRDAWKGDSACEFWFICHEVVCAQYSLLAATNNRPSHSTLHSQPQSLEERLRPRTLPSQIRLLLDLHLRNPSRIPLHDGPSSPRP